VLVASARGAARKPLYIIELAQVAGARPKKITRSLACISICVKPSSSTCWNALFQLFLCSVPIMYRISDRPLNYHREWMNKEVCFFRFLNETDEQGMWIAVDFIFHFINWMKK
jgi:hypothetical protein